MKINGRGLIKKAERSETKSGREVLFSVTYARMDLARSPAFVYKEVLPARKERKIVLTCVFFVWLCILRFQKKQAVSNENFERRKATLYCLRPKGRLGGKIGGAIMSM